MSAAAEVQRYLNTIHAGLKVIEFEEDTSTCELAARALGVEVGAIAKSLVFKGKHGYLMIVAAGDVRMDPKLMRDLAESRVRMATADETLEVTGHPVGGVCPFLLAHPIPVFIDDSLLRFDVVYAAAGTASSALPITYDQLLAITKGRPCSVSSR
jgi:prolyl-tRNA editing enzyme YbaK/EbsC (Cys-tRNA(Pro) deacylase)